MLQALHGESIYNYCVQFSAVWDNVFKGGVPKTGFIFWKFGEKWIKCLINTYKGEIWWFTVEIGVNLYAFAKYKGQMSFYLEDQ